MDVPGVSNGKAENGETTTEEELKALHEFINESKERIEFKLKLREENLKALDERPDESFFKKLDSNLKKNTAFVKKLKTISEGQKDAIMKELKALNLTKYIGEIASSLVEAKLKMSDVNCVLLVCSALHQRYSEFASSFLDQWQKILLSKKDEKILNPGKLRVDLRLFADLTCIAIFPEKEALNILANQLNLLTCNDKEEHINLSIIMSFCKHCGDDYAGLVSHKFRILSEKFNIEVPHSSFLKKDRQKACRVLLKDYYNSLANHVIQECKLIRSQDKQNKKIIQTKGELSAERKEKYELMQSTFQKLHSNAIVFADFLDQPPLELPTEELKSEEDSFMGVDIFFPGRPGDNQDNIEGSLFEDEDTRQFYETLPDLRSLVPGILYKDSEQQQTTLAQQQTDGTHLEEELTFIEEVEKLIDDDRPPKNAALPATTSTTSTTSKLTPSSSLATMPVDGLDGKHKEEDPEVIIEAEFEEEDKSVGGTLKLLLESFLSNLPNCVNRELIDKAAIDFCMNLNTKANRKKLVKTLFLVQRTRYDLLPFYSRLVAILHPCMPSISADLAYMLKADFRYHFKKKDQTNIEIKLKVSRFIGELVKFNMFNKSECLHCIKMLLSEFTHHNIEMTCALLETCGRFLYRSSDSHHRMKVLLDVMMRKKAALHLDSRYSTMIENAFYYSNPPEYKNEIQVTLPPMHQYIRYLLYKELSKTTVEKVLKQMRKLDWNDPEEEVGIHVVDAVLEHIRLGMEMNQPKLNQQRLSTVKYLGEMYNYRLVESDIIFKTLYSFITFETSFDENAPSTLDPPEHLLRIRLVCVLLDACGEYFDRGSSKKKLDCFLVYFQRYYWFKKNCPVWSDNCSFPRDVDNMLRDVVELLRPKLQLFKCWQEAKEAAQKLDDDFKEKIELVTYFAVVRTVEYLKNNPVEANKEGQQSGLSTINEETIDDDAKSDHDENSQPEEEHHLRGKEDEEDDEYDEDDDKLPSQPDDEDDDNHVTLDVGPKFIKCQEDDDFLSALDKMMSDSVQARQQEIVKIPVVEIAVPMAQKNNLNGKIIGPNSKSQTYVTDEEEDEKVSLIPFTVLTRKGNKPQLSTLSIPLSENFASKFKEQIKHDQEEKERMKRMVLEIHERQVEENYQAEMMAQSTAQTGTTFRDKRTNVQPPKGAPDADVIFGIGKNVDSQHEFTSSISLELQLSFTPI
ncbi:hypothetical protein HELRODRAFT_189416 [Helobdella robusta]|uniref:MIF4G domain-containing protein n=1 Tax=Helobdella robusta TaxID=6412 RepID=T1FR16_HELRO|nr:hypothetical protein HELRODRAFT_189416 [Helobdella robusta]ESN94504.1 hypothetical protein HELRODRAFT_189416 [Helobdella robusta]